SPFGQAAALALAHRCTFYRWAGTGEGATYLRVRDDDGEGVEVSEPVDMLDWIADLHPDSLLTPAQPEERARQRGLMAAGRRLPALLAAATDARTARDLDIAQHFLHQALLPFAAGGADGPLTDTDFLTAPVLWRLCLL